MKMYSAVNSVSLVGVQLPTAGECGPNGAESNVVLSSATKRPSPVITSVISSAPAGCPFAQAAGATPVGHTCMALPNHDPTAPNVAVGIGVGIGVGVCATTTRKKAAATSIAPTIVKTEVACLVFGIKYSIGNCGCTC